MTNRTAETSDVDGSAMGADIMRPRRLCLRLMVVAATLIVSYVGVAVAVAMAKLLGIDPKDLQGTRFVVTVATVSLFLIHQVLQALIVGVSQRFVHRRPFRTLGFQTPVLRNLIAGFAVGVAPPLAAVLVTLATGSNVAIEWTVPAGVQAVTVIAYYCFFFFIFLTANSFGEELVFRCYPIEQFRDRPRMMLPAIVLSTLIFAAIHFIIGDFNAGWFLILLGSAALFSFAYILYRSIWLVVGIHNGMNFVVFSLGGNWKMGGLIELSGDFSSPLPALLTLAGALGLVILLLWRFRPRPCDLTP